MKTFASLASLKGRRALVTGAAGGIGRVITRTLAELGAEVILVDRPGADYGALCRDVESAWGTKPTTLACDLESQSDRSRLIERVKEEAGGLDVLVNNAAFVGTSDLKGWVTAFENQSVETWRRAIEINLTAAFDLCKGLAPELSTSGHGSIINIGSIYGSLGPDYRLYEGTAMGNPAAYAASKGGLIQLTRWLSTTLAPRVRVNSISPGGIQRNQPAEFQERYAARTPLGRMGSEQDLIGAVAFFSSDLSEYVTGTELVVDGGWAAW